MFVQNISRTWDALCKKRLQGKCIQNVNCIFCSNLETHLIIVLYYRFLNFVAQNVIVHSKRKRTQDVWDGLKLTVKLSAKNWLLIHHLKLKKDETYPWNMTENFGKCQVSKYISYIVLTMMFILCVILLLSYTTSHKNVGIHCLILYIPLI